VSSADRKENLKRYYNIIKERGKKKKGGLHLYKLKLVSVFLVPKNNF